MNQLPNRNTSSATSLSTSGGTMPAPSNAETVISSTLSPSEKRDRLQKRVNSDRTRLSACLIALSKQVRNRSIVDAFLSCISPQTSIDGRMPFTPRRVITTQNKEMLVHNLIGHAILNWGIMARDELTLDAGAEYPENMHLTQLEAVAGAGLLAYGAYPKERNSAIYVLRTVAEERKLHTDRAAASEKALELKAKIREDAFDGEDKAEGNSSAGLD